MDQSTIPLAISFGVIGFALLIFRGRFNKLSKPIGLPAYAEAVHDLKFPLIDRKYINPHIIRLRFSLGANRILGLPIGRHVGIVAQVPNPLDSASTKTLTRFYTPVTSDFTDVGYFDLIIKVYRKNEHPDFPEGGWMSQFLESVPIGTELVFRGPCGRIEYRDNGNFGLGKEKRHFKNVGMIAGGTGITPMYQLIRHVLETRTKSDKLNLSLLYANRHPGDIILREELTSLAKTHQAPKFRLSLTVDSKGDENEWLGFTGFVSKSMIANSLPEPSNETLVLLCGPPPMMRSVEKALLELGHEKRNIHMF